MMFTHGKAGGATRCARPLAAALLLCAAGCQDYDVAVTIDERGCGTRTIELRTDAGWERDSTASLDEFRQLFGVTPDRGWSMSEERDAQDAERRALVFRHQTSISDPAQWRQQSGDLRILGGLAPEIRDQVWFANDIELSTVRDADGHTIVYRERFSWRGFKENIAAFLAQRVDEEVRASRPDFPAAAVPELRGAVSGLVLLALELQLREAAPEQLETALQAALRLQLTELARRDDPSVLESDYASLAERLVTVTFEEFDEYAERVLTGAHLAWGTSLVLQATLPGEIIESNASTIDGQTATWELDLGETLSEPREVLVRARMPG